MFKLMKETPRIESGKIYFSTMIIEAVRIDHFVFDFHDLSIKLIDSDLPEITSRDMLFELFAKACNTNFHDPFQALRDGIVLTENDGKEFFYIEEFDADEDGIGLKSCLYSTFKWVTPAQINRFKPEIIELI